MYGMKGKRLSLLDLFRQLSRDEFAPELERGVPVLFPFWKGWMLLGAASLRISEAGSDVRLVSGGCPESGWVSQEQGCFCVSWAAPLSPQLHALLWIVVYAVYWATEK